MRNHPRNDNALTAEPAIDRLPRDVIDEMAEALTQSAQKRQLAIGEYRDAVVQARRLNAIETAPEVAPDDSWVMGRL